MCVLFEFELEIKPLGLVGELCVLELELEDAFGLPIKLPVLKIFHLD